MTSNESIKFVHDALKDETMIKVIEKTFNSLHIINGSLCLRLNIMTYNMLDAKYLPMK